MYPWVGVGSNLGVVKKINLLIVKLKDEPYLVLLTLLTWLMAMAVKLL